MAASASRATPDAEGVWSAPYRVDVWTVLAPFARGAGDPATCASADGAVWRACRTPHGPGTLRLSSRDGEVAAAAWGPGADWLVGSVPDLLGVGDDPAGFPYEALPASLAPAWPALVTRWRVPRSGLVLEALVAAVLEQKVTGVQARRAWRSLHVDVGEPAPGPVPRPMWVLPECGALRRVPSWRWHAWGVGPQQSATLMRVLQSAGRVEECARLPLADARSRLQSIPGIGGWTVAEVAQRALGDPDAVSFGDFHLAQHLVYAFTGSRDGTDEQAAVLLEPFAGQRYRVQRLQEVSGVARPARGPRATIADHRRR